MNDYELDDFEQEDARAEFERYNNCARKYTMEQIEQIIERFAKSPSNLIWFDEDDDYDDIPY